MEIKICYSPYTLEFHSGAKRKGCLLRVEQEGEYGYADLHPWPEIGDGDLNQQLQLLKAKQSTPLLKRALYFAAVDREARKKQISLLTQSIPKSHYLSIGGYIPPLTELKEAGFTHIKIKIGKDPKQDALTLLNLSQEEHFNNFTLRLDANTKYSPDQFQFFLDSVESLNPQIDYIEDPIPYDELEWARLQERVTLAADQFADKALHKPEVARYLILKPAKMDLTPYRNCSQKCVITSYVAHPLEQLSASWEAANFYQQHTEICGLASHNAYKSNPYQNALVSTGPYLKTPTGYGFGFDEMLTNEKWIEL